MGVVEVWTDAESVEDTYRLYGQQVRVCSERMSYEGRLVQVTDRRWATVETGDRRCWALRAVRIETL